MLICSCVWSQEGFVVPQSKGAYFDNSFIEYSECDHRTSVVNSLGLQTPLCLGRIRLRMGLPCTSKPLQEVGKSQEVLHYLG